MPEVHSKTQRRLFGWAWACKKGYTDDCPEKIEKIAKNIEDESLRKAAKTKHRGLPEKVPNKKKKKKANEMKLMKFGDFAKYLEEGVTASNLSGMGAVKFPGDPGTTAEFSEQTVGSGDFPADGSNLVFMSYDEYLDYLEKKKKLKA